jgi:hypothetical protein
LAERALATDAERAYLLLDKNYDVGMIAADYLYGIGKPLQNFEKWKQVVKEAANQISDQSACIPDDFTSLILLGHQSEESYRHGAYAWLGKDLKKGTEIVKCHAVVRFAGAVVDIEIFKEPSNDSFPVTLEL